MHVLCLNRASKRTLGSTRSREHGPARPAAHQAFQVRIRFRSFFSFALLFTRATGEIWPGMRACTTRRPTAFSSSAV